MSLQIARTAANAFLEAQATWAVKDNLLNCFIKPTNCLITKLIKKNANT